MSRNGQSLAAALRLRSCTVCIAFILAIVVAYFLVPPWFGSWWSGLRGNVRYQIAVRVLNGCLLTFGATLILSLCAAPIAAFRVISGRKRRLSRRFAPKILLLSLTCLFA